MNEHENEKAHGVSLTGMGVAASCAARAAEVFFLEIKMILTSKDRGSTRLT